MTLRDALAAVLALMLVALVLAVSLCHPPETRAPLYREDDDGWVFV